MAIGEIHCHICNGIMYRDGAFLQCRRCSHRAEAVTPPSEADRLFKDEVEYKQSISKHGGGASEGKARKQKKKAGVPWYDIDRISAEGSPGQGFK